MPDDMLDSHIVKKTPNKRPRNPDAIMKANEFLKDQNRKQERKSKKDDKKEKLAKKSLKN
jgi:hypothetical protein